MDPCSGNPHFMRRCYCFNSRGGDQQRSRIQRQIDNTVDPNAVPTLPTASPAATNATTTTPAANNPTATTPKSGQQQPKK